MGQTNSDKQNIHSKHLPAIHEVIVTHNYLSVMHDNTCVTSSVMISPTLRYASSPFCFSASMADFQRLYNILDKSKIILRLFCWSVRQNKPGKFWFTGDRLSPIAKGSDRTDRREYQPLPYTLASPVPLSSTVISLSYGVL